MVAKAFATYFLLIACAKGLETFHPHHVHADHARHVHAAHPHGVVVDKEHGEHRHYLAAKHHVTATAVSKDEKKHHVATAAKKEYFAAKHHVHSRRMSHKAAPRVAKVMPKKVPSHASHVSHTHHHHASHAVVQHHHFLAHSTERKGGLQCYESETADRGDLNTCDDEDAACFIRYKEEADGSRSYYRRYCTTKSACEPAAGESAFLDTPGFQSYDDGDTKVYYRCCTMPEGCNGGAPAAVADGLYFISPAEDSDFYLESMEDGSLGTCPTEHFTCRSGFQPGQKTKFQLTASASGFSLTTMDGTPADQGVSDWMVSEVGAGQYEIADGGGSKLFGKDAFVLIPATTWDTVKEDRVCPTTKDAGMLTLSGCVAACEGDDECLGSVGWPSAPTADLCDAPNTCKCLLVTGPCEEGESTETAGMNVYAHKCSMKECPAISQCHEPGTCDRATGACSTPSKPDTTPCDDRDETSGQDKCEAGVCAGTHFCESVSCDAQSQCHEDGVCDYETGACSEPLKAQGASCDDNMDNTHDDVCDGKGDCAGTDYCEGTPPCEAAGECFEAGSCDSATGLCSNPMKAAGTECDDGSETTVNDVCDDKGTCAGEDLCAEVTCEASDDCHEVGTCDFATGECSDPLKPAGAGCDDKDDVTVNDQCDAEGKCAGTDLCAGVSCPDLGECFEESTCDQATGLCSEEKKSEGTTCDDGNSLTDEDQCTAGGLCAGTGRCEKVTCEALTQCHKVGKCDVETGICSTPLKPDGTSCNDGNDNTMDDRCDAEGMCAGENRCEGVTCDSPGTCESTGSCDFETGDCVYEEQPEGTTCDDGDDTTQQDACKAGKKCEGVDLCVGVTCEAASQCYEAGVCDQTDGVCKPGEGTDTLQKAEGTTCNDGSELTRNDACVTDGEEFVCKGEELCAEVTCEAQSECHDVGTCNVNTGECSNPLKAAGAVCDDGDEVTMNDQCTAAGSCVGEDLCAQVTCTQKNQCTSVGECDPTSGRCTDPTDEMDSKDCDDGDSFTRDDKCNAGTCAGIEIPEDDSPPLPTTTTTTSTRGTEGATTTASSE